MSEQWRRQYEKPKDVDRWGRWQVFSVQVPIKQISEIQTLKISSPLLQAPLLPRKRSAFYFTRLEAACICTPWSHSWRNKEIFGGRPGPTCTVKVLSWSLTYFKWVLLYHLSINGYVGFTITHCQFGNAHRQFIKGVFCCTIIYTASGMPLSLFREEVKWLAFKRDVYSRSMILFMSSRILFVLTLYSWYALGEQP